MAMSERALAYQAYEQAQSQELRSLRVLSGEAARERANTKRKDVVKLVLSIVAVLVYLLGVTFMESKIGDAGAEINSLKRQIAETETASLRADLEIGELSSLDRIESYAVANLGMAVTDANSVYYLSPESSLMIATGQQQLAVAETEPEAEEQPWLQSMAAAIRNYFRNTALAAGQE